MKVGVVVVTHGQLATELLNAAEMIVGDLPHFAAVSIGWHEDVDQAREAIGRAIDRVRQTAGGTPEAPAGALVLADMFGGTPANLGVTFLDKSPATKDFLDHTLNLLRFLVPQYVAEGKTYLTVGIGCTGGRHRSVAIAEALARKLKSVKGIELRVRHRDVLEERQP